jgi:hypothetical protein
MKRLERDRRHVELIVGVRKIVSVRQIQHRKGVTTYPCKTDEYSCGGRSPPSRSVGWTRNQIRNHQLAREHYGPRKTAPSKMECEENLILERMDKAKYRC